MLGNLVVDDNNSHSYLPISLAENPSGTPGEIFNQLIYKYKKIIGIEAGVPGIGAAVRMPQGNPE